MEQARELARGRRRKGGDFSLFLLLLSHQRGELQRGGSGGKKNSFVALPQAARGEEDLAAKNLFCKSDAFFCRELETLTSTIERGETPRLLYIYVIEKPFSAFLREKWLFQLVVPDLGLCYDQDLRWCCSPLFNAPSVC